MPRRPPARNGISYAPRHAPRMGRTRGALRRVADIAERGSVLHGPVMLKRLHLHNFNCFVDFELELTSRMLLVGSNGSGKSSLWEALAGLQDIIVQGAPVDNVFPTRSLTRWLGDQPIQRFAMDLEQGGDAYHYELELLHDLTRRVASIRREQLLANGGMLYESADEEVRLFGDAPEAGPRTRFPFGRKRSFLPELDARDYRRAIHFRDAIANI